MQETTLSCEARDVANLLFENPPSEDGVYTIALIVKDGRRELAWVRETREIERPAVARANGKSLAHRS